MVGSINYKLGGKKMKKTFIIAIVLGFVLLACTTKHTIKICNGLDDCNTFEYTGKSSVISP